MKAFVVLNPRSGSIRGAATESWRARIVAAFASDGLVATVLAAAGDAIETVVRRATESRDADAKREFEIVVVGGGDGSVAAAASVLAGGDVPLGVLPLGTFNHFARDLGLPLDLEAAVGVIARGHIRRVDVGEVNGRVFLNNSSLGIYPHLVAERDRHRRYGVARWVAALFAFCRVIWHLPRPQVRVLARGWQTVRRTPCLFIGNNRYELDAFATANRSGLDGGELCLYLADPQSRAALMLLVLRAFFGRLMTERDFILARLEAVDITAPGSRLRVSLDGESRVLSLPLHYRIRPRALSVIAPAPTC